MKKQYKFAIFFALTFLLNQHINAQTTIFGGRGLLRTQSAELVGVNRLFINSYFSAFLLSEKNANSLTKDYGLSINVTLGLNKHLEVIAHLKPYQDDQRHIWGAPGDTQLGVKIRSPFSGSMVHTAFRLFANLPTGRDFAVAYEPYASREVGIAGMGLITFDFTEVFAALPVKTHLNFGYFDQNIHDRFFLNLEDQYLLAAGLKFPVRSAIFYSEYSAEIFAKNEFITKYSMNSQRLTQGFKFLGPWNLIYDVALDLSLASDVNRNNAPNEFRKQYADWKLILGLNYPFTIQKKSHKSNPPTRDPQKYPSKNRVQPHRQNILDSMLEIESSLDGDNSVEPKNNDDSQDN
ncbi:MAG: hypothetical protein DWQ05_01125 [Calditrichaeota bacterium]|nr:MAG: hypothetical protein DWQ05_01125 [Calditrichota bacterium]